MAGAKVGSRGAAFTLGVIGLLTVILSSWTWGTCPHTPCGGPLMAISEYSGFDLGFGAVTALAGLALTPIGLDAFRHDGTSRIAAAARVLAMSIVVVAAASAVWMYVLPGDDKEFYWPPVTAILVGSVGMIAVVASVRLRTTTQQGR
jgi:hypothetical protein